MKKIILSIIFAVMMGFCASAQMDNIVTDWEELNRATFDVTPLLPVAVIGINNDPLAYDPAPLGDGLLILTALGAGYFLRKKKIKNNK